MIQKERATEAAPTSDYQSETDAKLGIFSDNTKDMHENINPLDEIRAKLDADANEAAEALKAEYVQAIGRKFVLYRESRENKQIELPKGKN